MKNLSLAINNLRRINDFTFYGLSFLRFLDLSYNSIETISKRSFSNSKYLIHLILKYNNIKSLDGIIWNNPLRLDLEKNLIENISLSNFPSYFTAINLKQNPLKQIYCESGLKNPDLSLNLDNAYFINILKENKTKNVQFFFLNDQNITIIKKEMFINLKKLNTLFLNNNKIKSIENESFISQIDLKTLFLNNNQLDKITEKSFKGLFNLKHLYLNNNSIQFIEIRAFADLKKIQIIYLKNNFLKAIPAEIFGTYIYLETINFQGIIIMIQFQY